MWQGVDTHHGWISQGSSLLRVSVLCTCPGCHGDKEQDKQVYLVTAGEGREGWGAWGLPQEGHWHSRTGVEPAHSTEAVQDKSGTHQVRHLRTQMVGWDLPLQKNTIQITFQISVVFEWFLNGTWMVLGGIMANGILMVSEWFFNDILNGILDSLYRSVVLNGILNYCWEYHWVLLKDHW